MEILGIDVGGRGIKGAVVETTTGALVEPRMRLRTPQPATPEAVAAMVGELVAHFEWRGAVGVGFPAVVRDHVVRTAANIDDSWIGVDAVQLFEDHATCHFVVANDADAAGWPRCNSAPGAVTTGALPWSSPSAPASVAPCSWTGVWFPNTELGHLEIRGYEAEAIASGAVRQRKQLSWPKWAKRMNRVLADLRIVGLARPDRLRWRDQQEGRAIHGSARDRGSDRAGRHAQPRRDRRCRPAGRRTRGPRFRRLAQAAPGLDRLRPLRHPRRTIRRVAPAIRSSRRRVPCGVPRSTGGGRWPWPSSWA